MKTLLTSDTPHTLPADENAIALGPFLGRIATVDGFTALTAAEYLAFVASVRGMDPVTAKTRADELAGQLGLAERQDEPVRRFSYGMRKKLSFMAAVLHRPAVLKPSPNR